MRKLNEKIDELLILIFVDYFPTTFVIVIVGIVALGIYLGRGIHEP